jgi:hypothetical protein
MINCIACAWPTESPIQNNNRMWSWSGHEITQHNGITVIILASILLSHHQQMLPKNSLFSVRCGLLGSCISGIDDRRLWLNKSGYDPVPSSGKWLGIQVCRTRANLQAGPVPVPFLPRLNTHPGPWVPSSGSLQFWTSDLEDDILGQHDHLILDKTRHNHKLPRTSDSRHWRADIHPITAWHSDSTIRIRINIMISLTSDKLIQWGRGSPQKIRSTRDPDNQHQNGSPFLRALQRLPPPPPPERRSKTTLTSILW